MEKQTKQNPEQNQPAQTCIFFLWWGGEGCLQTLAKYCTKVLYKSEINNIVTKSANLFLH